MLAGLVFTMAKRGFDVCLCATIGFAIVGDRKCVEVLVARQLERENGPIGHGWTFIPAHPGADPGVVLPT